MPDNCPAEKADYFNLPPDIEIEALRLTATVCERDSVDCPDLVRLIHGQFMQMLMREAGLHE